MAASAGGRRGLLHRLLDKAPGGGRGADLDASLEAAVAAHAAWKSRLVEAVITGRSPIGPAAASADDRCPFGVWLYEESDRKVRESGYYEQIRRLHSRFHVIAGGILGQALAGHTHEAMDAVRLGGEFDRTSATLIAAINEWRAVEAAH